MEKHQLYESKNCNSELFCRKCRPRLRRLEFEVNEVKLTNAVLKEHLHGCGLQCRDADQNSSGALSSSRLNTSPTCFLNSSETSSKVQTCESLSPAGKPLVDLQKKLIEWTEQYRLLAYKYNEMVGRLQNCQDALHCSSKQTYELEKVNLELQIKLKEILQVKHFSNEDIFAHKNQEFTSPSMGATLQENIKEESAQVDLLNAIMPNSIHDAPVPAAACAGSVTCDYQRDMMPNIKPHNAIVLPPNYCVDPPRFMRTRETALTSIPCVKMKAQAGDIATPYSQPEHIDGTHSSHFAVSASESGWSPVLSVFSSTNSSRQINTPLSEVASPSDHCRLKNKIPKDTSKADHSRGSAFPNVGVTSPIACKQSHDEDGSAVINVPKIISIRANTHGGQLNDLNDQNIPEGAAYDAAPVLSPLDLNKSHHHHRHSAPSRNEEMKVVALAKNMECVAFPQGAYKTEMCNKWVKNMGQYCPYKDKCQFAHGPHELRPVLRHRRYKSMLCRMVASGEVCPYEHRCHFRHVIYPHEAELLSLN